MTPAPIHTALADVAEIRRLEAAFSLRHPKISLMQRAGEAVAAHVLAYLKKSKSKNVLVLAGPGNNGGDAWVAAAALQRAKCQVTARDASDLVLRIRSTVSPQVQGGDTVTFSERIPGLPRPPATVAVTCA